MCRKYSAQADLAAEAEAAKTEPQNVRAEPSRIFSSRRRKISEPSLSSRKIFHLVFLSCP